MSVIALVVALLAEGHPLIQPVPESVLVVAGQDDGKMTVVYRADNRRTRKVVAGPHWNLEYDAPNEMERDAIIEHFIAENERLHGVLRRQAGNQLSFTVMREDGGETWCQVWATDGNYTLEIVDESPPEHVEFEQEPKPSATIVFERGASKIAGGAERVLDSIANWLEIRREMAAEIRAHRGPLENPEIVAARAAAVSKGIQDRGIAEARLIVIEDLSNQGFEVTVFAVHPPPPEHNVP